MLKRASGSLLLPDLLPEHVLSQQPWEIGEEGFLGRFEQRGKKSAKMMTSLVMS